jgi:NDMA-dependent alcohol dehydrogenase
VESRAAVIRRAGTPWSVEIVEVSAPRARDVVVELEFAGLCHTDDHTVTGDFAAATPFVGGHEGAGTVVAVGPGVDRVRVGDAVLFVATPACGHCRNCASARQYLCTAGGQVRSGPRADGTHPFHDAAGVPLGAYVQLGAFSERTVVDQAYVLPYRRDIPGAVAAVVSCAVVTGFGAAVNVARVRPGDVIVVVGAGGVGMSAVQGARIAGAATIVTVDPVAFKRDRAMVLGATHTAATMEDAQPLLAELTEGRMADSAVLAVGVLTGEMIAPAAALVGAGGTVVLSSVAPREVTSVSLPLSAFLLSAKSLVGTIIGNVNPVSDINRMLDLYRAGTLRLDEMIGNHYSLADLAQGFADMHAGKNIRGVIDFSLG